MWGLGIAPFLGLLAAIALLPLIPRTHRWWENNVNRLRVSLFFAGLAVLYVLWALGTEAAGVALEHAIIDEYIPFITLLLSLYVIAGGINLKCDVPAHPLTNTTFLLIGTCIASFIGTTGASMLLIRPLLQTNSERRHVVHTVVFFIFLVSNVGGCLLPIGDPPLFLGYLYGVPFFWTFNLWMEWATCSAALLAVYYVWDSIVYRRERPSDIRRDEAVRVPLRVRGSINFIWLAGAVACVAFIDPNKPVPGLDWVPFKFMRELLLLFLLALSLLTTSRSVRHENRFNYAAILEVAALFIGIFVAMQMPLELLKAIGPELADRGLKEPWHYFWMTGSLSSFLDNAPTYVVFFRLSRGLTSEDIELVQLTNGDAVPYDLLVAISLGSVFMGAMTYIGNGPNFMVKSIAEQMGVRMPSFGGFLLRYSIPILVPLFVIITLLFLRD